MKLKPFDYLAFILMLASLAFTFSSAFASTEENAVISITSPAGKWQYPLSAELVFTEAGPPGTCRIVVTDSSVRVTESSCPQNICISTGTISAPGEWIACLPHKVFIQVIGASAPTGSDGVDAASY